MKGWKLFGIYLIFVALPALLVAWATIQLLFLGWDYVAVDTWSNAAQTATAIGCIFLAMVAMWLYHRWATPRWRRWLFRQAERHSISQSTDQ